MTTPQASQQAPDEVIEKLSDDYVLGVRPVLPSMVRDWQAELLCKNTYRAAFLAGMKYRDEQKNEKLKELVDECLSKPR